MSCDRRPSSRRADLHSEGRVVMDGQPETSDPSTKTAMTWDPHRRLGPAITSMGGMNHNHGRRAPVTKPWWAVCRSDVADVIWSRLTELEGLTVDGDAIRQALEQLTGELKIKEAEVNRLGSAVAALQAILTPDTPARQVKHVADTEAAAAPPLDPEAPRGRSAVRAILEERAGQWVTLDELERELVSRGWIQSSRPREAARTSALRLAEKDQLVESGRARYRLIADPLATTKDQLDIPPPTPRPDPPDPIRVSPEGGDAHEEDAIR